LQGVPKGSGSPKEANLLGFLSSKEIYAPPEGH